MSGDFILNWSSKPATRKLMGMVGLPTPQPLDRADGAWQDRPLTGKKICVGGAQAQHLKAMAEAMGADVVDIDSESEEKVSVHALVYDASDVADVTDLRKLYDFFHPRIRQVNRCGRILLIGKDPAQAKTISGAAARQALVGFSKSVAKELGRKGSTSNMITLAEEGAEQLEGPLRFFLGRRSAFISGQSLHVSQGSGQGLWTQPLAGKTALVTGAARGIGEATARRLAEEGARVIVLDIPSDKEAIDGIASEIEGVGLPLDITDPKAAEEILHAAGGVVDVVVHNAGITRDKTLAKMDENRWDLTMEVNLASVLRVTQELLDKKGIPAGGRLVLVSSIAGIAGNMGQTNYAASKAGVVGLTHAFGQALKAEGISCNAVAPGFIETRLTDAIPFGIRVVGRRLSNLNQGGLPVDIADAVTFLSSPGAGGLHGNVLRVCGGNLLGA